MDAPDMRDFYPVRDLERIQVLARQAQEALEDENEGDFRRNIDSVVEIATKLQEQVHYM